MNANPKSITHLVVNSRQRWTRERLSKYSNVQKQLNQNNYKQYLPLDIAAFKLAFAGATKPSVYLIPAASALGSGRSSAKWKWLVRPERGASRCPPPSRTKDTSSVIRIIRLKDLEK